MTDLEEMVGHILQRFASLQELDEEGLEILHEARNAALACRETTDRILELEIRSTRYFIKRGLGSSTG